eukprot:TRINITY_DN24751_c0_g1_i1.p2 TRINITY_DN24751_c0_g1~~TRINITY_DN24751_c0_g1_i1.p2  ORF type:complete len:162 (+),score=20.61 TRINITY_DN24751_c0_g1_i1:107-592(+)
MWYFVLCTFLFSYAVQGSHRPKGSSQIIWPDATSVSLSVGEVAELYLDENPTTGYVNFVDIKTEDSGLIPDGPPYEITSEYFRGVKADEARDARERGEEVSSPVNDPHRVGVGGTKVMYLQGVHEGTRMLVVRHGRPHSPSDAHVVFEAEVVVNGHHRDEL